MHNPRGLKGFPATRHYWSMPLSRLFTSFIGFLAFECALSGQSTVNIFDRVLMIESAHGRASTFALDVDDREYWITAKHVITGASHPPYGSVSVRAIDLKLLNPASEVEDWLPITFTLIDTSKDVDIVVLYAPRPILTDPASSPPGDSTAATVGGNCQFLGFPFGGGWRGSLSGGKRSWMPYIKHCGISGQNLDIGMWVLDGINNHGFSGGPVIVGTGTQLKVMAVVSGYVTEPTDVMQSSEPKSSPGRQGGTMINPDQIRWPRQSVERNSGFVLAYDIHFAIDAIRKNPTGPKRLHSKTARE
jgi:hypothetical protein